MSTSLDESSSKNPIRLLVVTGDKLKLLEAVERVVKSSEGQIEVPAILAFTEAKSVLNLAHSCAQETLCIDQASCESPETTEELLVYMYGRYQSDYIVSLLGAQVFGPITRKLMMQKLVASHQSLLPAFPGQEPLQAALKEGVCVSGATCYRLGAPDRSMRYLAQEALRLEAYSTLEDAQAAMCAAEAEVLEQGLLRLCGLTN